MAQKPLLALLVGLALALSGCFGGDEDGDDGNGDGGDGGNGGGTTAPPTTGPGNGGDGGGDPLPAQDIYINGTVTGVADCSLAPVAGAQQGTTESVPPEAQGGSYELTVEDETGTGSVCIAWGDEELTQSSSGTVPDEVDQVTVAADGLPEGTPFSIRITPVDQGATMSTAAFGTS